jgi:hypothetical protein
MEQRPDISPVIARGYLLGVFLRENDAQLASRDAPGSMRHRTASMIMPSTCNFLDRRNINISYSKKLGDGHAFGLAEVVLLSRSFRRRMITMSCSVSFVPQTVEHHRWNSVGNLHWPRFLRQRLQSPRHTMVGNLRARPRRPDRNHLSQTGKSRQQFQSILRRFPDYLE